MAAKATALLKLVRLAIALKQGDREKLHPLLERLAEADPEDPTVRRRLALLSSQRSDVAGTARWAREAIHLNVRDQAVHRLLGEALVQLGHAKQAEFHQSIARELAPN